MESIALRLLLVVALVLINALFVAAEFSIVTVRRTRIEEMAARGHPLALLVRRARGDINGYLAACQLGITMASIGLGWIGEPVLAQLLEPAFAWLPDPAAGPATHTVAVGVAFGIITALHIVLGELAPKSVALWNPERTAFIATPPTQLFRLAFWPAIWVLNGFANALLRGLKIQPPPEGLAVHSAEELRLLVRESRQAGLLEQEGEVLERVFEFRDRLAHEVMVPRTEVVWLERGTPVQEFYRLFRDSPHSRFPVYDGDPDNVVGVVAIKDLLGALAREEITIDSTIDSCLRPALFVPETKPIGALFWEMQRQGQRLALVVDEYGGIAGLVTLEMLLEEMVGELVDEGDRPPRDYQPLGEELLVEGGMSVHEANRSLGLAIPDGRYETVAGFVLSHLGHIPQEGEKLWHNGWEITVVETQGVKVERVRLTRSSGEGSDEGSEATGDLRPGRAR